LEWQQITRRIAMFLDLPRVRPIPTLCTHVPLMIFLMSVMASDLGDRKIRVRGALGQIGPDSVGSIVILLTTAMILLTASYRVVTAADTLSRRRP